MSRNNTSTTWAARNLRAASAPLVLPTISTRPVAARRHGVFDAVLDDGLDREARHLNRPHVFFDIDGVAEPAAESHAFDVQVCRDNSQLLFQRHQRSGRVVE